LITDDEVMRVLEQANPISLDDPIAMLDLARYRDVLNAKNTTMTLIDTEATPIPPASHHRWLIITAAAAAAVTVAGLVLAARDGDETGVGSDPPPVTAQSATTAPYESGDEPVEDGGQLPVTAQSVTTAPYESGVEPVEDEGAGTRLGFIGLPPEGASPSTPESGEIVVSVLSCYAPIGDLSQVDPFPPVGAIWVLADGRLIWLKFENLPEGANSLSTGLLEQRLTPEGVELMRSEATAALSSGEVSHDQCYPKGRGYFVSTGGEGIAVSADDGHLAQVIDPWSWLSATAWEDPEIRAYVPSTYVVTREARGDFLFPNSYEQRNRVYSQLPAAAVDLLDTKLTQGIGWGGAGVDGTGGTFTTDEARALAAALDDAGLERDALLNAYRLDYQLDNPDNMDVVVHVRFYPMPPGCQTWDQPCSPVGIGSLMMGSGPL
jgi:hypothetical protein